MLRFPPDRRSPVRQWFAKVCVASLVYYVSFLAVGLIAQFLGYGNSWVFRILGPVFAVSCYLMPFGLVRLRSLRGSSGASAIAATASITIAVLTINHWIAIDPNLRNVIRWLWIFSEVAIAVLAMHNVVAVTKNCFHGPTANRVAVVLAHTPRAIRDDAEALINDLAILRDAHRAAGEDNWQVIGRCGWLFTKWFVRNGTRAVVAKLFGKLVGKLLGIN